MTASLEFEGRLHCAQHPDVALARVVGIERLVCVVCSTRRAAHLNDVLRDYVLKHPCGDEPKCWMDAQRLGGNLP